jgi:predicted enzyme related to lactoylglutathione lyase
MSTVANTTFDCADPVKLATFWAGVFEYDGKIESDDQSAWFPEPGGDGHRGLLFLVVPEAKTAKNRVHFDLRPSTTRDEEAARLEGLGAKVQARFINDDGTGFVVMQDPEGNEFCVERSSAERAGQA